MDQEHEHKYHEHEHDFERVDYPAVSFVKKVCMVGMLICIGMLAVHYFMPQSNLDIFLGVHQMLIVYSIGGFVMIAALVAALQASSR